MTNPSTTREALIVEALGEVATLLRQIDALLPALDQSRQALADARSALVGQLASFETRVAALTEKVKFDAVKHILSRTDEAARRSVESQSRAMTDAARVALSVELSAVLQRLQSSIQPPVKRPERRWELWLTHVAAAATASAATWTLAAMLWAR